MFDHQIIQRKGPIWPPFWQPLRFGAPYSDGLNAATN